MKHNTDVKSVNSFSITVMMTSNMVMNQERSAFCTGISKRTDNVAIRGMDSIGHIVLIIHAIIEITTKRDNRIEYSNNKD